MTHPIGKKRARAAACALWAALAAQACGGGSGAGNMDGGGGGGGSSGGGAAGLSWRDGGTTHTAQFAAAARVISASLDMVQITGSDSSGTAISFVVSTPPPLQPGAYSCGDLTGGRVVTMSYTAGGDSSLVPTCSITITSLGGTAGTHAVGTFTASLPLQSGSTRSITNGMFDVAQTVNAI